MIDSPGPNKAATITKETLDAIRADKKLSKRAKAKLCWQTRQLASQKRKPVAARVKPRRKKEGKPALPFPPGLFAAGRETEIDEVLLTQVNLKPPTFRAECVDDNGKAVIVAIQKMSRPLKGWSVHMPHGEAMAFRTKGQAIAFVRSLEVTELKEKPGPVL